MVKSKTQTSLLSGPVPYPLWEVVWDDASADMGWESPKKPKPELALTVGFLIAKSDDHIVLASTIADAEHNTNCRLQIPLGMIKHVKELTDGKKV